MLGKQCLILHEKKQILPNFWVLCSKLHIWVDIKYNVNAIKIACINWLMTIFQMSGGYHTYMKHDIDYMNRSNNQTCFDVKLN